MPCMACSVRHASCHGEKMKGLIGEYDKAAEGVVGWMITVGTLSGYGESVDGVDTSPGNLKDRGWWAKYRSMDRRAAHDRLLELMPPGAEHDAKACDICRDQLDPPKPAEPGGDMGDLTKEQHEAEVARRVAEALAPVTAKLAAYEGAAHDGEVEKRIADAVTEAVTPKDTEIADLRTQLDTALAERDAARGELDSLKTYLDEAGAEEAAAKEAAGRKDGRVEEIRKEAAYLSEEVIAKNADAWAAMSDEEFASRLEHYREIGAAVGAGKAPATRLGSGGREAASAGEFADDRELAREIIGLRHVGIDVTRA